MDREIKFKFWLGHTKKMTYEHSLIDIAHLHWDFTEDIIPLQFTGSKDKNKVEIYEGDILKNEYTNTIGVVVYDPDKCYFNVTDNYPDTLYNCEMINVPGDGWMSHEIEVIGNIYQNHELVNEAT